MKRRWLTHGYGLVKMEGEIGEGSDESPRARLQVSRALDLAGLEKEQSDWQKLFGMYADVGYTGCATASFCSHSPYDDQLRSANERLPQRVPTRANGATGKGENGYQDVS